ncbi:hypothetical protein [Scytonema hofmannii]|nr:hypothetical protein [Scytonema hofmannii]
MRQTHQLTAIIEREGDDYVALCPELDIAKVIRLRKHEIIWLKH